MWKWDSMEKKLCRKGYMDRKLCVEGLYDDKTKWIGHYINELFFSQKKKRKKGPDLYVRYLGRDIRF